MINFLPEVVTRSHELRYEPYTPFLLIRDGNMRTTNFTAKNMFPGLLYVFGSVPNELTEHSVKKWTISE